LSLFTKAARSDTSKKDTCHFVDEVSETIVLLGKRLPDVLEAREKDLLIESYSLLRLVNHCKFKE